MTLRRALLRVLILLVAFGAGLAIGRSTREPGPGARITSLPDVPAVGLEEARARTALVEPLPPDTIVFASNRTGNQEIYRMRPDGSDLRRLTLDFAFDSWWPRISPDRRRILFYRVPAGSPGENIWATSLWVMNADGSDPRMLRPVGMDGWEIQGHAEWSPSGREIVMVGGSFPNTQLFITDDEGRNPRQITHRPGTTTDPSWSPDGKTIAFVSCPTANCTERDFEIYTMPATGGEATRLTFNGIREHDPYFSPDGRQIGWIAETEPNAFRPGYGVWAIFLMRADGSDQRPLINDRAINTIPRWSKDGSTIYFSRYEPGRTDRWGLYRIRIDGTDLTEITHPTLGVTEYPSL